MAHTEWSRTSFSFTVIIAMTAFSFKMAARVVDVLESQIEQFCFIFSNNDQCNFTKTISHLRLCEYRDSHVTFGG